jgi:purine-binding chemotaxis protein CheW
MSAITQKKAGKDGLATNAKSVQSSEQFLTFLLSQDVFALGILHIKEILQFESVMEVPMMPSFIRGVINLRGRVVPVVDLALRFNRSATQIARRTSIVIIEMPNNHQEDQSEPQNIGIMVDAVNEVIDINLCDIEAPPSFGAQIRLDFIRGMARTERGFIILLNLDQILSLDELAALEGMSPQAQTNQNENL